MGKLNQGILGGISGSVGNVVGSSWKGIPVIKAKPLSVSNPRSAGQVSQRSKLTNIVAFAKPILSTIIKPLWDRFAQQQSGFNAFIRENIDLFEDQAPSPLSDLKISKGKMSGGDLIDALYDSATDTIEFLIEQNAGEGLKLSDDEMYAVVYNESKNEVISKDSIKERSDTDPGLIDVPDDWDLADGLHAYMAFRRADGTVVGETDYKEVVAV